MKIRISMVGLVLCYKLVGTLYAPTTSSTPSMPFDTPTTPHATAPTSHDEAHEAGQLLLRAVKNTHYARVQRLLAQHPHINLELTDPVSGMTPLMYAAKNGSSAIIGDLLEARAKIDTTNKKNAELLVAGNVVNGYKWTALMYAAASGHVGCTIRLLSAGANINAINHAKQNALMIAIEHKKNSTALALTTRNLLLESADSFGRTALFQASRHGNIIILNKLIQIGANVNTQTSELTPLMSASEDGDYDVANILLNAGANPNTVIMGKTALSLAIENDNDNIEALLRAHEATS